MRTEPASLTLHAHPLASYCWKVLIALYELGTPFRIEQVDGRPKDSETFAEMWPIAKMPLLQDRALIVPETSVIIEYLQAHHPGSVILIPGDADAGREVRLWDRFFDLYVHTPMQKLVSDRLRPEGTKDPAGVGDARATLDTAYAMLEHRMSGHGGRGTASRWPTAPRCRRCSMPTPCIPTELPTLRLPPTSNAWRNGLPDVG